MSLATFAGSQEIDGDRDASHQPDAYWIERLGSDRFGEREAATRQLTQRGAGATQSVTAAAQQLDPEVRQRAFQILSTIAGSPEPADAAAAVSALEQLAECKDSFVAARAVDALREHQLEAHLNEQRAIIPLRSLFAVVRLDDYGRATHANLCMSTTMKDAHLELLAALKRLEGVDLSGTSVTGSGLRYLEALPRLAELNLALTAVSDDSMTAVAKFERLERLNLAATSVGDAGMVHLTSLKRLRLIDISATTVSDKGFKELKAALPDCEIRR